MPLDLIPIKNRMNAATPGPWIQSQGRTHVCAANIPAEGDADSRVAIADCMPSDNGRKFGESYDWAKRDSEFIAHSRTDISTLIAEVERLESENARLKLRLDGLAIHYSQFCDCKQIDALLQKAMQELPDGDTVDDLQQIVFSYCPVCGKEFED